MWQQLRLIKQRTWLIQSIRSVKPMYQAVGNKKKDKLCEEMRKIFSNH